MMGVKMNFRTNMSLGLEDLFKTGLIEASDAFVAKFHPGATTASSFRYSIGSGHEGTQFSGTGNRFTYDSDTSINGGQLDTYSYSLSQKITGGPLLSSYLSISNMNTTIEAIGDPNFGRTLMDSNDTIEVDVSKTFDARFPINISIAAKSGDDSIVDITQYASSYMGITSGASIDLGKGNDQIQLNYSLTRFSITLGEGADKVVQLAQNTTNDVVGLRTIKDFNPAEDTIILPPNESGTTVYHIVDTVVGTMLRSTGANTSDIMLLEGISLNQIQMINGIISGKYDAGSDDNQYGLPIYGSDYSETLHGTDGNDLVFAGGGNDTVIGWNGDDLIYGEAGNDILFGKAGQDFILGDEGDDFIDGGNGNDQLFGGDGDDILVGREGNDRIFGEAGNDKLHGLDGNDLLAGGLGSDLLEGGLGNDHLAGGIGNDILKGGDGENELFGEEGDDTLFGGAGSDFFDGGAGVDTVSYADSKSGLEVYMMTESLSKGDAKGDTFVNVENILGSTFLDVIVGNDQDNVLDGGFGYGNDRLFGRGGDDTLIGGEGYDQLNGDAGNDLLSGGAHGDVLFGGTGDDQLFGDDGNDKLIAGSGGDDLIGGAGNDLLEGGGGNDFFAAGTGNDEIHMGEGNDYYLFQSDGHGASYGADVIRDFNVNTDLIIFEDKSLTADTINSFFQQTGEGLLIEVENSSVLLNGVTADDLNCKARDLT